MDLKGWVVVAVDGLRLVGSLGRDVLGPVYELRVDTVLVPMQGPDGKLMSVPQIIRQLVPVHVAPSITSYPLPADARCIALDGLAEEDQREWAEMIRRVQESIKAVEAHQRSGLIVGAR